MCGPRRRHAIYCDQDAECDCSSTSVTTRLWSAGQTPAEPDNQVDWMNSTNTLQVLNRLYAIHSCSLPSYLRFARPFGLRNSDQTKQTLDQIADAHAETTDKIGSLILQMNGEIAGGEYPMVFTGWHDLSIRFLIGKVVEYQQRDIAAIEGCVAQLSAAPAAKALAEECLGSAKGQLELLAELNAKSAAV